MAKTRNPGRRPLIPIGAVSQRTGLSQHILRIWERRYAAVLPKRNPDGKRAYDEADVSKLKLLKRATESGFAISRVAPLSIEEIVALVGEIRTTHETVETVSFQAEIAEILDAVRAMNSATVDDLLMRSLVSLGAVSFVQKMLPPLLHQTGDLWQDGHICPAHEHLLSASLQRILGWTMGKLSVPVDAPVIVAATLPGQRHEMGALMCAILAADRGWRVEYLGPDLPPLDVARAVNDTGARAVALSVVRRTSPASLASDIQVLRSNIGEDVPIYIGGREGWRQRDALARIGATPLDSLGEFHKQLGQ